MVWGNSFQAGGIYVPVFNLLKTLYNLETEVFYLKMFPNYYNKEELKKLPKYSGKWIHSKFLTLF
jgi:hypothetical protein